MPILSEQPAKELLHTVLLFGPPKSGKTLAVGQLAELGYNIWLLDCERGSLTLSQLSQQAKTRVHLYQIKDTAENYFAARTITKLLNWRNVGPKQLCLAHGNLDCAECKKSDSAFESIDISSLGHRDILVVDSLTQLSDSILNMKLKDIDKKADFDDWADLGVKLDSIFDWMKAASCHVIFISHEQDIKMEDGKEKLTAVGGTKNYARRMPRHFSHVVYLNVMNKKHMAYSKSTALNGTVTGSRTSADVEKVAADSSPLSAIFPKLAPLQAETVATSKTI